MKSFITGFILGMAIFITVFVYTDKFYKNSDSIFFVNSNYNTYLFDDGEMILPTKYKYVKLEDIPVNLINLTLWSEDRDFFEHYGFNPKTFLRAMLINIKEKSFSQGGSTITQQLAKTVYLTNSKSILRKVLDIMLAFFIERSYTKDEILEAYMNVVYEGNDISGLGAAATRYFRKNLKELDFNEMLMLVGIINSPEYSNPYKYPDKARNQAEILLNSLKNSFYFKPYYDEYAGSTDKINIYTLSYNEKYLDFIYEAKILEEKLNLKNGGYTIKTTVNKDFFESVTPDSSSSAIVINNKTGEILSFWGSQYSVFMSRNQIGSVIKPFYYMMSFERGYDFSTILPDNKMTIGNWSPQNYDKKYRGDVSLEDALVNSINIPSIYLAMHLANTPTESVNLIYNFLKNDVGLDGRYPDDLTISLGTVETSPFEIIKAFTIFPNYGIIPDIYIVSEIYDRKGNLVYKKWPSIAKRVNSVSVESYSEINELLRKVVTEGSGKKANIESLDLHGKTGTPDDSSWFLAYTGDKSIALRYIGKDILSTYTAVPQAAKIIKNFLYDSKNMKVPVYMNVNTQDDSADFFRHPVEYISKGLDVIEYLNRNKDILSFKELENNLKAVKEDIEYIFPDVYSDIVNWENLNLVDFLKDPYGFIQNNYSIDDYLSGIILDTETVKKLKDISGEISFIYPDISNKIDLFLEKRGF